MTYGADHTLPRLSPRPDRKHGWPAFTCELDATLAVHSQYLLHGNVRDLFLVPGQPGEPQPILLVSMLELLWRTLRPSGYLFLIHADPVGGFGVYPADSLSARRAAEDLFGAESIDGHFSMSKLRTLLLRICGASTSANANTRTAFVIDYASRMIRNPGHLDGQERDFFVFCHKLAHDAQASMGGPSNRPGALFSPVIWLLENQRDLPSWLTNGSERIRTILVPSPDLGDRQRVANILARSFGEIASDTEVERQAATFAQKSDGMTARAMVEVARLALDHRIPFAAMADAIRIFKIGVKDDPWRREYLHQRIAKGEKEVSTQVLGQEQALQKTFSILKRAVLGLSGAQAASGSNRPRGVFLFAGPTGVGKTELARRIASTLFGSDDSYLRFDMSEFSAEHSADRLSGAPPGYVGFEAGGELTNAIRQQPFRVVLFDEIEKAHPRVLDKFLQILDDGRLADGQGVTAYFSECVVVFTSNLGVMATEKSTGSRAWIATPDMPYDEIERRVSQAIREHFVQQIGRPELLNRIGDNIIVFNFITTEPAKEIFSLQLANIQRRVEEEQGVHLELSPRVRGELEARCCSDLTYGGRGIGNALESLLINPLAHAIFDLEPPLPERLRIVSIHEPGDSSIALKIALPKDSGKRWST